MLVLVWCVRRSGWCWPILHLFIGCVHQWGVAPGAVLRVFMFFMVLVVGLLGWC